MNKKFYQINGEIKKSDEALISVDDYGLMRGYGIFETIKFTNKKALKIKSHMDRLYQGLKIIKINTHTILREKLISDINNIININSINTGLIKIVITKGTPKHNNVEIVPNIYITIKEMYDISTDSVKIIFLDQSKYPIVRFSPSFKGINYIGNMMALEDANKQDAFEAIFYDNDGNITEGAMRNIFFIKNNTLITPSLKLGILSGTTRNQIKSLLDETDIYFKEKIIHKSEINDMDEAFICSSAVGILPCYWNEWKSDYKITKKLQFLLEESLKK